MFKTLATALTLSLALAGATAATASSFEKRQPEQAQMIRTKLQEQGYEVRKIDVEDGMIEVYALKDGKRMELYLDQQLNIMRTKGGN